jgi:chromosome segregation ATPase
VIYESMPPDEHQLFAGMTEEQLRQKLPAASIEEYLRHGQTSNQDDDEFRKAAYDDAGNRLGPDETEGAVQTVYHRRLRDYALEFRDLTERRAVLLTAVAGLTLDNQRLADALASAERLMAFRQDEANKLNSDLAGLSKDRQAVDRLLAMVEQQVERIRTLLEEKLRDNSRLASELAARQTAAAAAILQAQGPAETPTPLAAGRSN